MKYETVSMRAAKPVRSDDARPGDSYLRIDNVWKTFGDFAALKDVSLAIDEGDVTASNADATGGEPIFKDGQGVGSVTW